MKLCRMLEREGDGEGEGEGEIARVCVEGQGKVGKKPGKEIEMSVIEVIQ
jgi:hypothetical protein